MPWVILINGLADPQDYWAPQLPALLGAGYTVLTYDNRGVGLSYRAEPKGDEDEVWTVDDMASDLRSLVEAVAVPAPYHVMGVSMGGMIAQQYALSLPPLETESVQKGREMEILSLTLACTYAHPGPFCGRMFSLWRDMAVRMSLVDVMRDVLLWLFTPAFFTADDGRLVAEVEREIEDIVASIGLQSYLAQLNVIVQFDSRQSVARLGSSGTVEEKEKGKGRQTHVVVLAGEEDILIPVSLSRELHGLIPGATWRTTRGGHGCSIEFADEFNRAFLAGLAEAEEQEE